MQSAKLVDDLAAPSDKISKAALDDNTDVVTIANIDEVNAALVKQAK